MNQIGKLKGWYDKKVNLINEIYINLKLNKKIYRINEINNIFINIVIIKYYN
jgi:hypothetical protein